MRVLLFFVDVIDSCDRFFGVNVEMVSQLPCLLKQPITYITPLRLYRTQNMHSGVKCQVSSLSKPGTTKVTLVWRLAAVDGDIVEF